jgi:hypothetical protein
MQFVLWEYFLHAESTHADHPRDFVHIQPSSQSDSHCNQIDAVARRRTRTPQPRLAPELVLLPSARTDAVPAISPTPTQVIFLHPSLAVPLAIPHAFVISGM